MYLKHYVSLRAYDKLGAEGSDEMGYRIEKRHKETGDKEIHIDSFIGRITGNELHISLVRERRKNDK